MKVYIRKMAQNFYVSVVAPQMHSLPHFLVFLENLFDFLSIHKYKLFLCGDFNIDILLLSPYHLQSMSLLESNGFSSVISALTRVASNSSTTLIGVFIKYINRDQIYAGVLLSDVSDHFSIYSYLSHEHQMHMMRTVARALQELGLHISIT